MSALASLGKFIPRDVPVSSIDGAQARTSRSSAIICAVVVAAFGIEAFGHAVHSWWPDNRALATAITMLAITTLLSPGLYLILRLHESSRIKTSIVVASILLVGSQFIQVVEETQLLAGLFATEAAGPLYNASQWIMLALGLVLMLASLYFALLEMESTKWCLLHERGELVREIMVRMRAEEALTSQEKVYHAAIAQAGAIPYRIDWATKTYHFYDKRVYDLTGFSPDELTFEKIQALPVETKFLGPLAGLTEDEVMRLMAAGALRNWHSEYKLITKQGEAKWISDSSVEILGSNGRIAETVGLFQDITERKREEELLSHNERYFRALIENALDVITVLNADGTIRYASPSAVHVLGYEAEELIGTRMLQMVHPDDRERMLRVLQQGIDRPEVTQQAQYRCRHKDGSYRMLESIGRSFLNDPDVNGAIINSRDISERVQLENQLLQSQKMEGIGRLAGGVAHDFNNLLTCIMGYCELALLRAPEGDKLRMQIEQIVHASHRAAELTRQLLAFARKQIIEPKNTNLNSLTLNLDKMLQRLIGEDIELLTLTSEDPAVVRIDPGQFEQVVINLAVNARDAMPEGGQLTIEIQHAVLNRDYTKYHPDVKPGEYVMFAMSDTGMGMPEEVRARIFEPFFTTKEDGKGTGLGMAMCYGIVRQAGGHIWVYSEVGKGSTFKIYLPKAEGASAVSARPAPALPAPGGDETVLLVEDEPLVRGIAYQVLTERGYTVLEAQDGASAIALAAEHQGQIDLVLTDVVMPKMSGRELVAHLRDEYPRLKVMYMSGYTEDAIVNHGVLERGIIFLAKPFSPETLAHKVRAALDDHLDAVLTPA